MKIVTFIILPVFLMLSYPSILLAYGPPPKELVDAANKGDPVNEWALGHYYLTETADRKQAYFWLKKAADAGQINAKIELGANFAASGGTPFDDAQASGIAARAGQAMAIVRVDAPDARLVMFRADTETAPQYIFFSPEKQLQIAVIDQAGSLVPTLPTPGSISLAVPRRFVDLPKAIVAARGQGMQGDSQSAVLTVSQASNKPPVALWMLTPVNGGGRFLSYFVAAEDGRPLALSDFSDGINGTDSQLTAIYNAEHPRGNTATDGGSGGTTTSAAHNSFLYPTPMQQYWRNRAHGPGNNCGTNPGETGCR